MYIDIKASKQNYTRLIKLILIITRSCFLKACTKLSVLRNEQKMDEIQCESIFTQVP